MNIIYHCVGGSHSSVIASAIHLGILPIDKKPSLEEILSVPYFDRLNKQDRGKIIFRGIDKDNNKIFTLSRQFAPNIVIPAIKDSWELAGGSKNELLAINTMSAVNLLMKIGGFSSRRLKLVSLGRPIVARGTLLAYNDLVNIVQNTKDIIKQLT
ncbi:DUF3189 family protein [Thermohalobacter berrensis]|uniref:DUF3189 family protein n=1 Tax=Thermohalobacter berrensis TaxID=99594 RepID=A0A419TB48_9FIRM|nr:DUF3189 family protein [Thermohalobacter berrensis]RKD34682.1 hypothetical protein BET03_02320 [Thermohalobacter berrensis]